MQASPALTDGPIYDLPEGIGQEIVCDERNREYLLLTTEQGGVFLMPYLDEDGEQERVIGQKVCPVLGVDAGQRPFFIE